MLIYSVCVCVCVCVCVVHKLCEILSICYSFTYTLFFVGLFHIICPSLTSLMLFYFFLFFSFLTHCSFAFSSKYDNETIHSDHIFCAQNTDNSYNHFLCTEHRDNSYNHFLCGEQYRHWVKSLNVLCVEHSIIILWVKRGFLWKCAQVLFGITEYLYYYFMSAEHRRLILTIICVCVCVKKLNCDHHFVCEKH